MQSKSCKLHSSFVQCDFPLLRLSKNLLAAPSRTEMTSSNINRTVLAVVLGSVLAGGMAAPAQAQAWRQRHAAQEQSSSASTQDSQDAREARKKEREAAESARQARAEAEANNRQREQAQRMPPQDQRNQ